MTEPNEQEFKPPDATMLAGGAVGGIAGFLVGLETYDTYFEAITEQPERSPAEIQEVYDKAAPPYIVTIAMLGAGIGVVAASVGRGIVRRIRG